MRGIVRKTIANRTAALDVKKPLLGRRRLLGQQFTGPDALARSYRVPNNVVKNIPFRCRNNRHTIISIRRRRAKKNRDNLVRVRRRRTYSPRVYLIFKPSFRLTVATRHRRSSAVAGLFGSIRLTRTCTKLSLEVGLSITVE